MTSRWSLRFAALVLLVCVATAGCSVTMASIPVPDGVSGDTYEVDIEFASVLNIPAGGKVLLDGNQVGHLSEVHLGERTATATVEISDGVSIPRKTRAELRQETLLGDLYIALTSPPEPDGEVLADGDRIPLSRTSPPDNVETVMVSMAQMISGGVMSKLQEIVRKTNDALPDNPDELAEIARNASRQIIELGESTRVMNQLLEDGAGTLQVIADRAATVERTLTVGPDRFETMQSVFLNIVELISDLRSITIPGANLLAQPTYRDLKAVVATLDPMVATLAEIDRSLTTNADLITRLLTKKLVPFLGGAAEVNVVGARDREGRAVQLVDFLRAIGMV